jgi:GTPase SAR1 family protein
MNLKVESLTEVQKTNLKKFLKKINYPREELVFAAKIELNVPNLEKKGLFDDSTKIEDLIHNAVHNIGLNWLISTISSDIFKLYEKSISRGQVEALIRRILGFKLTSTGRSQLYELRKKIRRYEKFITYFGEWGKEPDQVFKVIIMGLSDDQSQNLSNILLRPKVSGHRSTLGVDFYIKTLESYDKSLTTLHFWNISRDKRYEFLRERYYKGASAIIIIYEKGNQDSLILAKKYYSEFKEATKLKFKIKKLKNMLIDTPVILVGLGDKPVIPLEGGPNLAIELGARYFDKKEITVDEFEDVFNLVSLELLVKYQNVLK